MSRKFPTCALAERGKFEPRPTFAIADVQLLAFEKSSGVRRPSTAEILPGFDAAHHFSAVDSSSAFCPRTGRHLRVAADPVMHRDEIPDLRVGLYLDISKRG